MSFSSNIQLDRQEAHVFVRVSPRIRVENWTLFSGSVYRTAFTFGPVTSVDVNNVALTEGASTALSAGQFYHDVDNGYLYIRKTAGTPVSTDWVVATFELYFSTVEAIWYRTPTDNTTQQVLWRGILTRTPEVNQSSDLIAFGFFPITSSDIGCLYDRAYLQELLYASSFHRAEAEVWKLVGDLDTANIQADFSGVAGNYAATETEFSLSILDKTDVFDEKLNCQIFDSNVFTNLDPDFDGAPIQTIYGMVQYLKAVNVDITTNSPTTSNNRYWAFCDNIYGNANLDVTITSVNTNSQVFVATADAVKLQARMTKTGSAKIWVHSGGAYTSNQTEISSINTSTGFIIFTSSAPSLAGWTISMPQFIDLQLVRDGAIRYDLKHGRDYQELTIGGTIRGILLSSSTEATLGITVIDPSRDKIVATKAVGYSTLSTLGGSSFGSSTGNYCNQAVAILYHLLKDRLGFSESEIDTAQFTAMLTANSQEVGFAVPQSKSDDIPTYKEVITRLLTTLLVKAYFDADGALVIEQMTEAGAAVVELDDEDIMSGSFKCEFSYDDLSAVDLTYAVWEAELRSPKAAILGGTTNTNFKLIENSAQTETLTADAYMYLHKGTRSISVESYSNAEPFRSRIKQLVGERKGQITLITSLKLSDAALNDAVSITRTKLPGSVFDGVTASTRTASIMEIKKQQGKIVVVLDDQKAISDNAGSW